MPCRLIPFFALLLVLVGSARVRAEGWQARAQDWHMKLVAEDDQGLTLSLQLEESLAKELADGRLRPEARGEDDPPLVLGRWIALPASAVADVEPVSQLWSRASPAGSLDCCDLSAPVQRLGQRMASLGIQPVADDGTVLLEMTLRIRFVGGEAAQPGAVPRAGSWLQLERAGRQVLNPGLTLRQLAGRTADLPLGRYLVVGKEASLTYMANWAAWRRQQGFEVALVSSESLGVTGNYWAPIRDAAQAMAADEGLDYLLLIGDMNIDQSGYHLPGDLVPGGQYAETNWGRRIVSDHTLALLEGDDYFADVLVGRFSADNATQVSIMASRALLYDQQPTVSGDAWLSKALMVYDVAGAASRRETSLSIRQHLMARGIAPVDTIRNNRYTNPQSPTLVTNAINDGRVVVNYRGYGYRYSWNGPLFGVSNINQLSNYGRWPLVTSIVCGGGDFASANYDPCLGEAFLRVGSTSEPKGAVAFIGPSEEDTHTRWNNTINMGIYQGLLEEGIRDVGALMDRGKAELWHCFPNHRTQIWHDPGSPSQTTNAPFYFYCYNLLGDPGTRLRLGSQRTVAQPAWTPPPAGSTQLELMVSDTEGQPGAELWVCLSGSDNRRLALARTDADGRAVLDFAPLAVEASHLVIHGDDWIPLDLEFTPAPAGSNLVLLNWSAAAEDSLLAAGDEFALALRLREAGVAGSPAGRRLSVEALDDGLTVLVDEMDLPALASGEILETEGMALRLAPSVEHGRELPMRLTLREAAGELLWERRLVAVAAGARPELLQLQTLPPTPVPGAVVELLLTFRNAGPLLLDANSCRLFPSSTACTMLDADAALDPLEPGAEGAASFRLLLASGVLPGARLNLELVCFRADHSMAARLPITLAVGEAGPTDPVGPDDHGYLIYHHGDSSPRAPVYDYHDITQLGTELPMNDEGAIFNDDGVDGVSRVLPLPFPFRFYGVDYDTITVCSNGWIAMGAQPDHIIGLNTPIPAAQGPAAMVAVFWTDLYNYYGGSRFGRCYRHHDEAEHTFTIQWNNFHHTGHPYQDNWFQAVLRDPAWWPTPTSDGEILLQYQDIVTTFGEHIFTVGVERPDEAAGLQYTFNGQYPPAGQPVTSQTALLITTAERFEETALPAGERPRALAMAPAAPNPFNPETIIRLELPSAAPLQLSVYNLRGELVRRLHNGPVAAGHRQFRFHAGGLAGGVYLVEARQGGHHVVQRVLLLP